MDELITEAKKYLPRCVEIDGRYSISKRMKGTHEAHVVRGMILEKKIQVIFDRYKSQAKNVVHSMTTKSIYFDIGSVPHRISNHYKSFGGNQIIIDWNTPID
jgi:hypothetical protein